MLTQECREGQHHACSPGWNGCSCWCHDAPPACLDDASDFPPAAEAMGDYLHREPIDEGI